MERDEEIYLTYPQDEDAAIGLLRWHFSQARMRGETIVMEIWSPVVIEQNERGG
jgi:hypothetical protein